MLARCRKFFTLVILLTGILHASSTLALGLGELTVNSTLNEPLDASIQMLGLDGLNDNQILASLGGLEDFERAGIDRIGLIDDIRIEIVVFNRESGILRLTSEEPVVEPFLDMVISVRWPNGRLMRDYTALIDLPVFVSDQPQAVPVDVPEATEPVPAPEPVNETPIRSPDVISSSEPAAPVENTVTAEEASPEPVVEEVADSAPAMAGDSAGEMIVGEEPNADMEEAEEELEEESITVEAGDSLYNIAATYRPTNSVSVEQTMLAIQRANPDAFIDDNINPLRVGEVLRIPSVEDIQSIDQTQAQNQIALQNQAVSVQPLALTQDSGDAAPAPSDELAILGGEDGTDSLSGNDDLAETIAALENQLAISEENLDRARLENQELRARFAELEEQIEILQNIIAMQDERLAQVQANFEESVQEAATTAPPTQTAQPAQPTPQDNTLMGQLSRAFENTLVLAGSLFALILAVVGILVWRRRAAETGVEEFGLAESADARNLSAETDGASAGFLAGMKARFSKQPDGEDGEDGEDEGPAVVAPVTEQGEETATEAEIETNDAHSADDEGFLGKLKGMFRRSTDEDDSMDDPELAPVVPEITPEENDSGSEDETVAADEDLTDEVSDDDFLDLDESEEDEDADSLVESIDDLEELDDTDSELKEEEVDFDAMDFSDLDEDDQTDSDDALEATDETGDDGEVLDFDLEDISNLDMSDEAPEEDTGLDGDVAEQDEGSTESTDQAGETGRTDDEDETFDFSLDESLMDEPSSDEESADEDPSGLAEESEDRVDVETFDFSLDDAEETDEPANTDTPADEAADSDLESFEFKVEDSPSVPEAGDHIAGEEDTDAEEDVETFDFDVSDISSFEDSTGEPAGEESEDVETFSFDITDDASDNVAGSKAENDSPEDDENVINLDEEEPVIEFEDDILGDDSDEVAVELSSGSDADDPLAAALAEIDAESDSSGSDDRGSDSQDDEDVEFDLGEIEIDDSLFETDDVDESSEEPISDRDEASTKLDLAVAYEAMGDLDGAREILNEVISEGNDDQVSEAKKLLEKWDQS